MRRKTGIQGALGSLFLAALIGCSYDSLIAPDCDPNATATYSGDIKTIMQESCNSESAGCHSADALSLVALHDYDAVKLQVDNGKLLSSIIWDGNASFMPSGSSTQIDSCSMNKVIDWINDGAPNN